MSLFSEILGNGHVPSFDLVNTAISNASSTGVYKFSSSASDKPNTNGGIVYAIRMSDTLVQLAFEDTTNNTYRRTITGMNSTPSIGGWSSIASNPPAGVVNDTGGNMYGLSNGGINMVNLWTYSSGAISKNIPQTPVNGDTCTIVVTNGRTDNVLLVGAAAIPIHGITDNIVLNMPGMPITFKYFSTLNQWRLI